MAIYYNLLFSLYQYYDSPWRLISHSTFPLKVRKILWGGIQAFGEGYLINNPDKLTLHRFKHIFHQVRLTAASPFC